MTDFISSWFFPPGINILFLGIGFFIHHWWKWSGRLLMAASLISLYVFSTMAAGNRLLYDLQQYPPFDLTSSLDSEQNIAIVVLGGGRRSGSPEFDMEDGVSPLTLERLRYAAILAKQLDFPLLFSGGRPDDETTPEAVLMNQAMIENFDYPVRFLETESRNTYENAQFSNSLLKKNNINSVILVTHAWHMKRAVAHFKSTGLSVYPAPMGFVNKRPAYKYKLRRYSPSGEGLKRTARAFRERLSLWWSKPEQPETEALEIEEEPVGVEEISLKNNKLESQKEQQDITPKGTETAETKTVQSEEI